MPDGTATTHLYRPKLLTILDEGYGWGHFRADTMAGLTVAIVALPLSMAIAVASGVSPESTRSRRMSRSPTRSRGRSGYRLPFKVRMLCLAARLRISRGFLGRPHRHTSPRR